MPFMIGRAPVRRTLQYLEKSKLIFQPEVRVLTLNYNINQKASVGAYEFQFWHFPQIKYQNREMQLLKFKNITPTPFIQLLFIGGEKVVIDLYGKTRIEIHDHLLSTFCETKRQQKEKENEMSPWNPGGFGYHTERWCICELPGQVPCPSFINTPKKKKEAEDSVD